jgi:signal transduction histidine kinase
MPSGGIVRISAAVEDDGQRLDISIVDAGAGMTEEDLKRLGEPFFTKRRGGIGLGFSLARRVIIEHGGEVQVTSQQGRGTTVVVSLPVSMNASEKQLTDVVGRGTG